MTFEHNKPKNHNIEIKQIDIEDKILEELIDIPIENTYKGENKTHTYIDKYKF